MLDAAGHPDTRIVLSSALDEITIWQIRNQIAEEAPRYGVDADHLMRRIVYGVGSRMVTSDGDPALDGVYKVVAVESEGGWVPAIKISDSPAKTVNPGAKALWRVYDARGRATADLIGLREESVEPGPLELRHPSLPEVSRRLAAGAVSEVEPLLARVLDRGRRTADPGDIEAARSRRAADLDRLDPGVRRLVNPHTYHVSLTPRLWELKQSLVHRLTG
jgi:nicotinate phosphoribosyltransferase